MAKNYAEHYLQAKKVYAKEVYAQESKISSGFSTLSDINVKVVPPREKGLINSSSNLMRLVDKIHDQVKSKFDNEKCLFVPPNIKKEDDVVRMLKDAENFKVEGLEDLCEMILPELESKYFQSYLHAEKVYFYRNIVTDNPPRTSWLWHYDNHPVEMHKVIIYLTDVYEDSGPFEYLKDANGLGVIVPPSRTGLDNWKSPKWKGSRVPPEVIENYKAQGCKTQTVIGPRGTILIFDDNVIHRANIGKSGHRDVLSIQIRPATKKMRPYISPEWTGGYEANDIVKDPDDIKPYSKF